MPQEVLHTESTPARATAGPWTAVHNHLKGICFIHGQGEPVAVVLMRTAPERDSNADLIASAPDLLRMLKEMRDACAALMRACVEHEFTADAVAQWQDNMLTSPNLGVRCDALIAKAEGRA